MVTKEIIVYLWRIKTTVLEASGFGTSHWIIIIIIIIIIINNSADDF